MAQKILVIDEASATARMAETILQQSFPGCDVLSAARGSDGCDRIEMASLDVVLLNETLPDMQTDLFLARLLSDPANAHLPVLIFGNGESRERLATRFPNVRKVLSKPLCAESLRDALKDYLCASSSNQRMLQSRSGIAFSGNTGSISIAQALRMAQADSLSGVLRFHGGRHSFDVWMTEGRVAFASTRNVPLYCSRSPVMLTSTDLGTLMEAQLHQQTTSCPVFLYLSARNAFPHEDVERIVHEHGQRLFAQLFTMGRVSFDFTELDSLPDFATAVPPTSTESAEWLLGALRHVRLEQLAPSQRPDPKGDPAYTRRGYELVQKLKLNEVEARFATAITGGDNLQMIAEKIELPLPDAMLVVFRFIALEIIDFWNPGLLALPASDSPAQA